MALVKIETNAHTDRDTLVRAMPTAGGEELIVQHTLTFPKYFPPTLE